MPLIPRKKPAQIKLHDPLKINRSKSISRGEAAATLRTFRKRGKVASGQIKALRAAISQAKKHAKYT